MAIKKKLISLYEYMYDVVRRLRFNLRYRYTVMSMEETVEQIRITGCSIARFGDGEFGLITGSKKPSFQEENERLAERLRDVCACRDSRLLICIPHTFKTTKDCNDFAKRFWDWWVWENDNLEKVAKCLQLSPWRKQVFGNAQITRPYMDWKDKSQAGTRFRNLMSLWEDRDIIIVEGSKTKLGVGNDLLNGARSVFRIICPAKNAFDDYDLILHEAKKCSRNRLFLLALGPTATVLACDLMLEGFQALDIGHIDIEYEWYLHGVENKIAIPGKHTQEVQEDEEKFRTEEDEVYASQIIARIG